VRKSCVFVLLPCAAHANQSAQSSLQFAFTVQVRPYAIAHSAAISAKLHALCDGLHSVSPLGECSHPLHMIGGIAVLIHDGNDSAAQLSMQADRCLYLCLPNQALLNLIADARPLAVFGTVGNRVNADSRALACRQTAVTVTALSKAAARSLCLLHSMAPFSQLHRA